MPYDRFISLLRRYIYIVYYERYVGSTYTIDKMGGKHPLLKPEMIIINDQIQGFKRQQAHLESLEQFPVFIEVESMGDGEDRLIESVDIQAELVGITVKSFSELSVIAGIYQNSVVLDRISTIGKSNSNSLMVSSRLGERLMEWGDLDNPIDYRDLDKEIKQYLRDFVDVIHSINLNLFGHKRDRDDT